MFHLSLYLGDRVTIQLLIDRGADVNATEKNHDTPLHEAALAGKFD